MLDLRRRRRRERRNRAGEGEGKGGGGGEEERLYRSPGLAAISEFCHVENAQFYGFGIYS